MKLEKIMEDRLISVSESIKHIATSEKGHIPDKISGLLTNISLIKLEVERLRKIKIQKL